MKIFISRDNQTIKWGLRLKGGKDFGNPLMIDSVTSGQIASKCGLLNGDFITKINGKSTKSMKHHEAQSLIRESGNQINFEITRGGLYPQYSPSSSTENLAIQDSEDVFSDDNKSPTCEPVIPTYRRPSLPMPSPFKLQSSESKTIKPSSQFLKGDNCDGEFKSLSRGPEVGFVPKSTSENNNSTTNSSKPVSNFKAVEEKQFNSNSTVKQTQPNKAKEEQGNDVRIPGLVDKIKSLQTKPAAGKQSVCKICRQSIQGMFYTADTGTYCKDHFKCSACCVSLIKTEFMEKDGFLWCKEDYLKRFAEVCGQCGQPISGSMVSALGKQWHSSCFSCCTCHQQIKSSSFRVNDDNKPVCDTCWNNHFQKKCFQCRKPIEGIDWYQEANGKHYHSHCFICSICSEQLKAKVYLNSVGHLLCEKHSNSK